MVKKATQQPSRYVIKLVQIDGEWRNVIEPTPTTIAAMHQDIRDMRNAFEHFILVYSNSIKEPDGHYRGVDIVAERWQRFKCCVYNACKDLGNAYWHRMENQPIFDKLVDSTLAIKSQRFLTIDDTYFTLVSK